MIKLHPSAEKQFPGDVMIEHMIVSPNWRAVFMCQNESGETVEYFEEPVAAFAFGRIYLRDGDVEGWSKRRVFPLFNSYGDLRAREDCQAVLGPGQHLHSWLVDEGIWEDLDGPKRAKIRATTLESWPTEVELIQTPNCDGAIDAITGELNEILWCLKRRFGQEDE